MRKESASINPRLNLKIMPETNLNNHKVLLVNPPRVDGLSFSREGRCQEREDILGTVKPPYSLVSVAAFLRLAKIDFKLIDADACNLNSEMICDLLIELKYTPNVIIYCTTTPTIYADTLSLYKVKKTFNAKLIAFGAHLTSVPIETLEKLPEIDIGITGEPEYIIADFLKQNDLSDLSSIKGIAWRKDGDIILNNGKERVDDLNKFPTPAWDLIPLDKYTLPFINKRYLIVETSRGCPFFCDFCVAPLNHGLKFRQKDPEIVVNEIEELKNTYGVEYFNLFGDTVTLDREFVNKLCERIIKRDLKIKWFTNTRVDTLEDINLLWKMKKSGCWMLSLGIESCSKKTRKEMHKEIEDSGIKYVLDCLRKVGIRSFGFFIYGYPGENENDLYETTKYAVSLSLDYANFYPAVPYPATSLYNRCLKEGYLSANSDLWEKMEYTYYIIRTEYLNENVVKKAISHAYLCFYLRPCFIARHLRNIGMIKFLAGTAKYSIGFIIKNIKKVYLK